MKPVIRQVKSMSISCDRVGNILLAKFSAHGASDAWIQVPAQIVFWLLRHLPVNQDPNLQAPPAPPRIHDQDWRAAPRALTVNCKEMPGKLRMAFALENKQELVVVLDRSNVELLRQLLVMSTQDLFDLDAA